MYKAILYPALSSRVILNNQARLACCYDQAPASGNVQGISRESSREFREFPGISLISLEFPWKILWNSPGTFPGIPWNSKFPGIPLEFPGTSLEFPWNFPDQGMSGNSLEFPWNFPGKFPGISLEFP